ncbi:MAG TPA: Tol-Pal system beta propeller repeat protein TolB [Methylomirabilota bacterium]|jgi:TolB protein|nr:Tol-Pal system beta propeller repeat protein TolB [Methylomirabilota bacterium]
MARWLGLLAILSAALLAAVLPAPTPSHSQGVEVFLNVTQGGSKKLGIAIPEFTRLTQAPDEGNFARAIPEIIGNDLRFSALFAVANVPALPATKDGIQQEFARLQQAGAHAAMHGLMRIDGQRLTIEFRLHDLTNPEFRLIASKMFWVEPLADHRRLAHRIADEVVHQFTGERGIAETKIVYVSQFSANKELVMIDYDGFNQAQLTNLRSTSLSPAWSPTDSSVAFTSFFKGYPYLFRIFPFNPRRRGQDPELMSAWPGINTAPAWAPDGRTLALTLSKGGNPDIFTLRVGTSDFRQLTNSRGIETDPSWSPTGRQIVFTSDRSGSPQIWVMDAEGTNARRLSSGGSYDTQPRWSPRGDTIVFTRRTSSGFDLWAINPDGSNARPLTQSNGSNEGASWAPNGRHLVFSSTRGGRAQLYTMLADGTEQQPLTRDRGEASSPTWSPRPQ